MISSDSGSDFPDEVPVADAVEQSLPAVDQGEGSAVGDDTSVPLETDEPDWQEQRQVVEDFGEDEFR